MFFIFINIIYFFFNKRLLKWRKIDLNYHIRSASTADYQLSDFPYLNY